MSDSAPTIVWLRHELRLADHPALHAALKGKAPVVPVYILDQQQGRAMGGASAWWLHHSLAHLAADIDKLGGQLILRRGDSLSTLKQLVGECGARAVYLTRSLDPGDAPLEQAIKADLEPETEVRRFGGRLLFEPEQITKQDGSPYKVFTPFWRACLAAAEPPAPLPPPKNWPAGPRLQSESLEDWALLPTAPDWAGGLRERWEPGEAAALACLEDFLEAPVRGYAQERDTPAVHGTSRLSPHLRFGEISPRTIWHLCKQQAAQDRNDAGVEPYLRQLGWREFSYQLLFHEPRLAEEPLREEFAAFPWLSDADGLRAWSRGRTGYPFVDAGMRELWATGWMHNRVRMVTASLLVKDLLIPWQDGERWFWDTLVDADPANNAAGWQWVAGCGTDAAPYFRIFNPVSQSKRFDPDGRYIRRWIPELADCPDKLIHTPWEWRTDLQEATGYPPPIVDHGMARERALAAYKALRDE